MRGSQNMMGRRIQVLFAVVMVAAAVLVPAAGVEARTGSAATAAARGRPHHGPFAVGVRTEVFVDHSRVTASNDGVPGLPYRRLETTIWYPAEGEPGGNPEPAASPVRHGRFPLVVFAHGFGASGPIYSFLTRQFAAAGYVVAAPTFPLTNIATPGGATIQDYVNQPGDVSFVLSEVLRLNREKGNWLRKLVDKHRIGAAGHSLGAITTLAVAYNTCCDDRRIDAAVPMSGIRLPFGGGTFFGDDDTPLLLVHGDADPTVPYVGSTSAYADAAAPKYLLTLLGGSHVPFGGRAGEAIVDVVVDFFDRYLGGRRHAVADILEDGDVPGVATIAATPR